MEDIDFWAILIVLLVIGLAIFLTYQFTRSKLLTKVKSLEEREKLFQEQFKTQKSDWVQQFENQKKEFQLTKSESEEKIKQLTLEQSQALEKLNQQNRLLAESLARQETENRNLEQRLVEEKNQINELNKKFEKEFENLANKILEEKSQKFATQNKENIELILNPLQEKIKGFEKRVEDTHKESLERSAALRQQIMGLKELNEQMSKDATNLTKALKGDSKMQGNWGEMVLSTVLERSGLEKDQEYFVQQSFVTEEGKRYNPDVVVHLPGDKKMIIDSKVSLTAYENYINESEEDKKPEYLKLHLQSVRRHVDQLSEKNYQQMYPSNSPDFVLLFIPIEAAFAVASNEYPQLYQDAFEKNIILVTPTTLLAVLKTIDTMWQNEKQKQNAIDIATQAGKLYDTFVNLTNELIKVGKQLNTVQGSYESAMIKLQGKGNLINRVENLKKLGAKASKEINPHLKKRAEIEENSDYENENSKNKLENTN